MTRTPAKAAAKKAAPRKRPAKKAAAKKAAPAEPRPPQPTVQIEIRVDNRIVCLQDVAKSSVKVALKDGRLSVAATTADAVQQDTQPAEQPVEPRMVNQLQSDDPPTSEQFDNMVATGVPNKAVEFHQDPRVEMRIHEAEPVVEKQAREAKGK